MEKLTLKPIFNLVVYKTEQGKYILVYGDNTYECTSESCVLDLITTFAGARFEW